MNISTNLRRDGVWDKEKQEFSFFSTVEESTFFEFNKEFTMIKHTAASNTSAYMIKSSKHDEERDQYELEVTSDVGNKYSMIIDLKNNNLGVIVEKDDNIYLVHYKIKKVWFDEE